MAPASSKSELVMVPCGLSQLTSLAWRVGGIGARQTSGGGVVCEGESSSKLAALSRMGELGDEVGLPSERFSADPDGRACCGSGEEVELPPERFSADPCGRACCGPGDKVELPSERFSADPYGRACCGPGDEIELSSERFSADPCGRACCGPGDEVGLPSKL
jgi:hypothetical protein